MPTKRSIIHLHNRSDLAVITLHLTFRTWCAFYYSDRSPTHAHSRLHLNFRTCTAHSRTISQATTPTNSPPEWRERPLKEQIMQREWPKQKASSSKIFLFAMPRLQQMHKCILHGMPRPTPVNHPSITGHGEIQIAVRAFQSHRLPRPHGPNGSSAAGKERILIVARVAKGIIALS